VVAHCDESIFGGCNEITFFIPVANNDFLAVLRDAWNLTICFAIEENN
jgi:hypothetical protein